jgi:hypothetical protein
MLHPFFIFNDKYKLIIIEIFQALSLKIDSRRRTSYSSFRTYLFPHCILKSGFPFGYTCLVENVKPRWAFELNVLAMD